MSDPTIKARWLAEIADLAASPLDRRAAVRMRARLIAAQDAAVSTASESLPSALAGAGHRHLAAVQETGSPPTMTPPTATGQHPEGAA